MKPTIPIIKQISLALSFCALCLLCQRAAGQAQKNIPVEVIKPAKASTTSMFATFTPVENNKQKITDNATIYNAESVENNISFEKFVINEDTLRDVMIKSKEITTPEK